jgi:hypothetical protein
MELVIPLDPDPLTIPLLGTRTTGEPVTVESSIRILFQKTSEIHHPISCATNAICDRGSLAEEYL